MILSSHCPTNTKASTIISQKAIHTVNLGVRIASPAEVLVDAALGLSYEALGRADFVIVTEFKIIEEATFTDKVGEACKEAVLISVSTKPIQFWTRVISVESPRRNTV